MIGGIIGDIVGSVYECVNHKSKDFEFFPKYGSYTDDSVLTIATAVPSDKKRRIVEIMTMVQVKCPNR